MARASFLLLRQLRRTHKAPLPLIYGDDSRSRLHSLPNLPTPPNGLNPPHSRFFRAHSTFSSDFLKKGFLTGEFCARAYTSASGRGKREQLLRDFHSSKITAERLDILEEMRKATSDDVVYVTTAGYMMGQALLKKENDPENALPFVKCAVDAVEAVDTGDTKRSPKLAVCLNLLGEVYSKLNRLDDALECFERALGLLDGIKDSDSRDVWCALGSTHLLLSSTKIKFGKKEEAAGHLRNSMDIEETKLGADPKVLGFGYMDIAKLYAFASNYKEALPFCLKALDSQIELGLDVRVVALVRQLLGKIYTGLEEHEKGSEQEELARDVLNHTSNDSIDSVIEAAKMLIDFGRWLEAMKILEVPLLGAYFTNTRTDRIAPEMQKKFDEARELWRSCEKKGLYREPFYDGNQAIDLGKGPNIM